MTKDNEFNYNLQYKIQYKIQLNIIYIVICIHSITLYVHLMRIHTLLGHIGHGALDQTIINYFNLL